MIGCAEPTGTNCNAESPCCASDQLAAPTLTSLDQLSYTNLSLHQTYKLPGYKKKCSMPSKRNPGRCEAEETRTRTRSRAKARAKARAGARTIKPSQHLSPRTPSDTTRGLAPAPPPSQTRAERSAGGTILPPETTSLVRGPASPRT